MLREFDLFEKHESEGFVEETDTGRTLTFVVILVCAVANVSMVLWLLHTTFYRELSVASVLNDWQSLVNISLSVFVDMPCFFLHLDVFDAVGDRQVNVKSTVTFRRIDTERRVHGIENRTDANYCGPCYGMLPAGECCLTCEMLRKLARRRGAPVNLEMWEQCNGSYPPRDIVKGEKCLVKGKITVNRVSGEFHIAAGVNNFENGHGHFVRDGTPNMMMRHKVERLRFGNKVPTASSPLVGNERIRNGTCTRYQYYVLVTPLELYANGEFVRSGFEYNAYEAVNDPDSPGLFFRYQFLPYTVAVQVRRPHLMVAYANMCCFLAGIYTIASLVMFVV